MNLIVPVAGQSSRFPGVRPKWLLTHPKGTFMVTEAVRGLSKHRFDAIYIVALEEHQTTWKFHKTLHSELESIFPESPVNIILLAERTCSQVETVLTALKEIPGESPFAIKDSDNYFQLDDIPENAVAYVDLNNLKVSNTRSKSYIQLTDDGLISNIVEKKIISPYFSCGLYTFRSPKGFLEACERIGNLENLYLSDVICYQLFNGEVFTSVSASDYLDWGTIAEWGAFRKGYKTLFIDLDGTLLSSDYRKFDMPWGDNQPLNKNINILRELYEEGKTQVIITTARPEIARVETEAYLKSISVPYDQIIFGLLHAQRVVINDFSQTNPYPSCSAINIKRDSETFELYGLLRPGYEG